MRADITVVPIGRSIAGLSCTTSPYKKSIELTDCIASHPQQQRREQKNYSRSMVITNLSSQDRVDDLIYRHIGKLEKGEYKPAIDRPFFVAERSKVIKQHQRWKYSLPDIQPYYGQFISFILLFV